jgi:hypothetical protein
MTCYFPFFQISIIYIYIIVEKWKNGKMEKWKNGKMENELCGFAT